MVDLCFVEFFVGIFFEVCFDFFVYVVFFVCLCSEG